MAILGTVYGLTAVLGLVLALVFWLPGGLLNADPPPNAPTTPPASSLTDSATGNPAPNLDLDTGTAVASSPAATDPPAPDPGSTAEAGDCFVNDGSYTDPAFAPSPCATGHFQVLAVLHGTTSVSGCSSLTDDDLNEPYQADDDVICTTFDDPYGNAYHARPGACVWGPNERDAIWTQQQCEAGNFQVVQRLTGTNDSSQCPASTDEHYAYTTKWSQLDVVLCDEMIYPNAAGTAHVGDCLLRTPDGSAADFSTVGSCDQANIVVTGKIFGHSSDAWFCGGSAWTSWTPDGFPGLGYTLCFRYIS